MADMVNKLFGYSETLAVFNTLKISANAENTHYTIGGAGAVTEGQPDVLWNRIVFIEDAGKIWTRGKMYINNQLSKDGATYRQVTKDDEILFEGTTEGQSYEDAIIQIDNNVATLVSETLDNELVIATAINALNKASGFNEEAEYEADSSSNYIQSATSLADADNLLDGALKTIADSIPTSTNDLTNNSGFITSSAIPTKVSAFENDKNYLTSYYTPTKLSEFVNDASYLTSSEIESKISSYIADLVDAAPEALNTLNELAAALGDDPNFAGTVTTEIGKKANNKIETDSVKYTYVAHPETNQELFINSYSGTTLEQFIRNVDTNVATLVNETLDNELVIATAINKLNIASGFNESAEYEANTTTNYIASAESLKHADELLDSAIKTVASNVPTNLSQLTNDANYLTSTEIDSKISTAVSPKADNTISTNYEEVTYEEVVDVNNTTETVILFEGVKQGETLEEAIHQLDKNVATLIDETIKNELVVSSAVNTMNLAIGLNTNANYIKPQGTNFLDDSTSIYDALLKLDAAIGTLAASIASATSTASMSLDDGIQVAAYDGETIGENEIEAVPGGSFNGEEETTSNEATIPT